jgi:NAD+ synthase (glutamine-hydrolysing)
MAARRGRASNNNGARRTGTTRPLRLALAQVAPALGDLDANLRMHLATARRAAAAGARLVVFPELSLTGYRLQDLVPEVAVRLDRPGPLAPLLRLSRRIGIVAGLVEESEGHRYYNSAVHLEGGRIVQVHRKVYLPTYGMFEEGRYLAAGDTFAAYRSAAGRMGILVCEDAWHPASALLLAQDGADFVLVLANGPTQTVGGVAGPRNHETWRDLVRVTAQMQTVFVALVNRVGVEDGVGFFGASMVVDPLGRSIAEAPLLREDLLFADLDRAALRRARTYYPLLRDERLPVLARGIDRLNRVPVARRGPGGS